jgi:hypothetical protein
LFLDDYQAALAKPTVPAGQTASEEFVASDRERLVSSVARFFMPWAGGVPQQEFRTAQDFEKAFVGTGASSNLADLALQVAASRSPQVTCESLTALAPAVPR